MSWGCCLKSRGSTYPSGPQGQPHDFQPNREPHQLHPSHASISEFQSAHQQRDQEQQDQGHDVSEVSDDKTGLMQPLHKSREFGVGAFRGRIDGCFLVQWVGGLVELVDGLGATRPSPTDGVAIPLGIVLGRARHDALGLQKQQVIFETGGLLATGGGRAHGRGHLIVGDGGINSEPRARVMGLGHVRAVVRGGRHLIALLLLVL